MADLNDPDADDIPLGDMTRDDLKALVRELMLEVAQELDDDNDHQQSSSSKNGYELSEGMVGRLDAFTMPDIPSEAKYVITEQAEADLTTLGNPRLEGALRERIDRVARYLKYVEHIPLHPDHPDVFHLGIGDTRFVYRINDGVIVVICVLGFPIIFG